jgi:hypothetical protein
MEQTLLIATDPDQLVTWAEGKLERDFPNRVSVSRPIARRNFVQAGYERTIFPVSWFGWIFNLTMTVLTLGSWLVVYALWVVFTIGDYHKYVKLEAYPADKEGFARVTVEGNREDWFNVVLGWLRERYTIEEEEEGAETNRSRSVHRDAHLPG